MFGSFFSKIVVAIYMKLVSVPIFALLYDRFGSALDCDWSKRISLLPLSNRPFPSSCLPPLQSESKCEGFVMKISFHSYVK